MIRLSRAPPQSAAICTVWLKPSFYNKPLGGGAFISMTVFPLTCNRMKEFRDPGFCGVAAQSAARPAGPPRRFVLSFGLNLTASSPAAAGKKQKKPKICGIVKKKENGAPLTSTRPDHASVSAHQKLSGGAEDLG